MGAADTAPVVRDPIIWFVWPDSFTVVKRVPAVKPFMDYLEGLTHEISLS